MRILILVLSACLASAALAQEVQQQTQQQAPQPAPVQTQQHPEGTAPGQPAAPEPAGRTAPAPPQASPAAPPVCPCEPRRTAEDATEYWPPVRGYRLKITDTLIAAFVALLFVATWLLWRALQKLVSNAELNGERQLRAYLAAVPKTISGFRPGGAGRIEWVVRNLGQTPAQKVRLRYNLAVLPHPLPARYRFAEPARDLSNLSALLPRDETVIHLDGDAFTAQQVEAVSRNEARIHCWGHADYEDVFRVRWRSRFSVSVGGEAFSRAVNLPADHPSAPQWAWEYGGGHNEIDHAR